MSSRKSRSALIFKVNQLGDNLVFLPVIERLVADRAFDSLTLWTTPLAAPLYREFPHLNLQTVTRDNFYPAWKSPKKLSSLIHRVRSAHARFALVTEDMGNTAYLLALLSGAKKRLGIRPSYLKIPFAINEPVSLEPDAPAVEKAWRLGSALAESAGGRPWRDAPPAPDLSHLIDESASEFDVVIHAGASKEYKRWPLSRYHELATRLAERFRVGWFDLAELPPPPGDKIEIIPSQKLSGLVSCIANAGIFIGNNSGPMNIASALGTPSVILVGPSARSWDPYWHPDRFRVLRHDRLPCIACDPPGEPILEVCRNAAQPMACMTFWTVDRVESEVDGWLDRWSKGSRPAP